MLGSRIICEGKGLKFEGVVKYAEGHFIVVEAKYDQINVGQPLQCKLYESNSIQTFQTTVVGRNTHHFIITIPTEIRDQWMISRESIRFPVDIQGEITAVSFSGTRPLVELIDNYTVNIHDISDGGVGFSSSNYLREGSIALIHFKLSQKEVFIEIEIVQNKYPSADQKYYYGGKFLDTKVPSYQIIRAFTFQAQLKKLMNREHEGE